MNKTFTLNGKKVKAVEFDYNLVCDLEELGFDIDSLGVKPMSTLRGYVACCIGCDLKKAGKEIGLHMANGGALDDILQTMTELMEDSRFFQGQSEDTQTEVGKSQSKTKK